MRQSSLTISEKYRGELGSLSGERSTKIGMTEGIPEMDKALEVVRYGPELHDRMPALHLHAAYVMVSPIGGRKPVRAEAIVIAQTSGVSQESNT
ncbi:hypothetical protein MRB53_038421 [Persea americana]|nr:hypothetical protein MRB53_038421 [Persea americana]